MTILCPPELGPDVLINRNDPCFLVGDYGVRDYIRANLSIDQMKREIEALGDLAQAREEFGDFTGLGLKPIASGYMCVDSGHNALMWLHEHERQRKNMLSIGLPTSGEEAVMARERIKARIAGRHGASESGRNVALQAN